MLALRRILFPTDFSDGAALAFPQAAALAAWHDAELHVLNVTERAAPPEETLPVSLDVLRGWLGRASDAGPTDEFDLEALSLVQHQVDDDSAAERIVAYAEAEGIDLVVMSTHGRRGVQRMLLGSVTEEVVRTAPCPVLAVRSDGDEAPSPIVRRILVPVDFSDASSAAVRHANALAQTYGAEIDLLHVVEQVVYPSAYGVEPAYFPTQEVLARVERTLGEMAREGLGRNQVQVSAVVGYAPMSILDHADEHDIDLIVIATHGRSGLDRMLLGSVAERVLRRAPTPVFIVKPDRASLVPPAASETAAASS
jgi:nucleotide-binding universal stress UspA family protein